MASLVLGLVGVIQLESSPFISAGWPLWGPVRAFRGQQVAGCSEWGSGVGVGTALVSSWTQRGVRNEAQPAQQLVVGSEVACAGSLGAGRLSPDTRNSLYERIKSGALFPRPGNQGLRMLFCVEVPPPTHSPFFFLPLSHCWLCLCPPCLGGGRAMEWWRWARDRQSWGSHLCWGRIHWS